MTTPTPVTIHIRNAEPGQRAGATIDLNRDDIAELVDLLEKTAEQIRDWYGLPVGNRKMRRRIDAEQQAQMAGAA
ncbi:MAG: hypothetical protein FWD85_11110 [Microbacteriaceae bacterium]|nr:hypothetical protein [Microbacteriaceae bacterium]